MSVADTYFAGRTSTFRLGLAEAHVWHIPLALTRAEYGALEVYLLPSEIEAARRYVFARHRDRFIAARASLRRILGAYLGQQPQDLRFRQGPHGKPELVQQASAASLDVQFNLSHSGDWALVVVGNGFSVGIDIEQICPDQLTLQAIEQFLSPGERRAIASLPAERRLTALFKAWTSKEAYVKGLGAGLAISFTDFEVCVDPDRPARLLRSHPQADRGKAWTLHDVAPIPGYRAAVAASLTPAPIMTRVWQHGLG
jgi:4'-phosphopantetheinyl transferase